MNKRDKTKALNLAIAMFNKKGVTLKNDANKHSYIINRIDLEGNCDIYSSDLDEVIAHDVPMAEILIIN
jgi:hypothetical protein